MLDFVVTLEFSKNGASLLPPQRTKGPRQSSILSSRSSACKTVSSRSLSAATSFSRVLLTNACGVLGRGGAGREAVRSSAGAFILFNFIFCLLYFIILSIFLYFILIFYLVYFYSIKCIRFYYSSLIDGEWFILTELFKPWKSRSILPSFNVQVDIWLRVPR